MTKCNLNYKNIGLEYKSITDICVTILMINHKNSKVFFLNKINSLYIIGLGWLQD